MTNIEERLLESKMTEIERARSWSPRVISKFETLIRSADDQSLYRINPLAFARDRAIAESESIDLFLHATRSGLFDMSWDAHWITKVLCEDMPVFNGRYKRCLDHYAPATLTVTPV